MTQSNAKQTQESTQTNVAIFQTKRKFSKRPKTSNVIYVWSNKEKNQSRNEMTLEPKQSLKNIKKTKCNQSKNETSNNQNDLVPKQKAQCVRVL